MRKFQIALKALPFFTDYFKIDYPLPKLDVLIATEFVGGIQNQKKKQFQKFSFLRCNGTLGLDNWK